METEQESVPAVLPVLYAEFGDQAASRTGFDGASFQWRDGDRIRVTYTVGGTEHGFVYDTEKGVLQ